MGFPSGSEVKNLSASAEDTRDTGSILGQGRSPGEGNGNPLQYCFLRNPMNREAWWATGYGVAEFGHDSGTKQQQIFKDKSLIR